MTNPLWRHLQLWNRSDFLVVDDKARLDDESAMAHPESLTELLRVPSVCPSVLISSIALALFVKQHSERINLRYGDHQSRVQELYLENVLVRW
jgi:hypothetical protein